MSGVANRKTGLESTFCAWVSLGKIEYEYVKLEYANAEHY